MLPIYSLGLHSSVHFHFLTSAPSSLIKRQSKISDSICIISSAFWKSIFGANLLVDRRRTSGVSGVSGVVVFVVVVVGRRRCGGRWRRKERRLQVNPKIYQRGRLIVCDETQSPNANLVFLMLLFFGFLFFVLVCFFSQASWSFDVRIPSWEIRWNRIRNMST